MSKKKKSGFALSAFSIILILLFGLGILSHILPNAKFVGEEIVNGSGTVGAKLSDVLMAPILGFADSIDVCVFVLILGGFLAIVTKTGALETGIHVLVKKLKGKELILIPILMFIFSVGGTTYGMLEETVGFYVLLAATMMAAGMDPLVGSATILLGAGSGVLGSTINPFATGAAIAALPAGVQVNQGAIILIGTFLWLTTLLISVIFVMTYAAKVKKDKGSTFLSLREQKNAERKFGNYAEKFEDKEIKFWLSVNKKPPYVDECDINWEEIVNDYNERMKHYQEEGIKAEIEEYEKIVNNFSQDDVENLIEEGILPDRLTKIVELDINSNNFISKNFDIKLGSLFDIIDIDDVLSNDNIDE